MDSSYGFWVDLRFGCNLLVGALQRLPHHLIYAAWVPYNIAT